MNLQSIISEVLQDQSVKLVIGYGEGSNGKVRPHFIKDSKQANELIFDDRCTQNLAGYLVKKDIKQLGRMAIVSTVSTLRSIIRLAGEHQLKEGNVIALIADKNGEAKLLSSFEEIETYISTQPIGLKEEDKVLMAKIEAMTLPERWAFWQAEFSKCFKCYACRQACPLCYCDQCTVEMNQPQWISVASSSLGNLEWHLMRAMHLAGRCISCGQCAAACPMDIPLHLLTFKVSEDIKEIYGSVPGMSLKENCAMSTFKPDDKENFIG